MISTITTDLTQLRSLVVDQARRWRRLQLIRSAGVVVALPVAILALAALLDNLFHLPTFIRAVAAVCIAIITVALVYAFVKRWRTAWLPEEAAAIAMEQSTPGGVQNRLINSIQLAAESGESELVAATVKENCSVLKQTQLQSPVRIKTALLPGTIALVLLLVGGAIAALAPDQFANATSRILRPLAGTAPYTRTVLEVEPGDVEPDGSEVLLTVRIRGDRPAELIVVREINGISREERIPVPEGADRVNHLLTGIKQSQLYCVRGGDFESPKYRIEVAAPATLIGLRGTFTPAAYTNLVPYTQEFTGGDIEARAGTTAKVVFLFDQPADRAKLVIQNKPAIELDRQNPTEFRGTIVFATSAAYQLEIQQGNRPSTTTGLYSLRVLPDLPPRLELTGLAGLNDVALEAKLPVTIRASDDLGLDRVGLFARAVGQNTLLADAGWIPVQVWQVNGKTDFHKDYELAIESLGMVEGTRAEIALRGRDTNPARAASWLTGPSQTLTVGGAGAALQAQYEQILRTEAELRAVLASQKEVEANAGVWLKKFDVGSGIRWDDAKNVDELHAAVAKLAKGQQQVQLRASAAAKTMPALAGNLKLSVGLLADAEMTRSLRAIESIPMQDQLKKRVTLGDAVITQTRINRSLGKIIEHFVTFRQDWEAEHALAFIKMLADRQAGLRDESLRRSTTAQVEAAALMASRRQAKIGELCQLFSTALDDAGKRLAERDAEIASTYSQAGEGLRADPLRRAMETAVGATKAGQWDSAVAPQTEAAGALAKVHDRLRKALELAARKALQALADKAKNDLEAQKTLEKLQAGTDKTFLDLSAKLQLSEIIHAQEVAQTGKGDGEKMKPENYLFPDSARGMLQQPDTGKRQQFDILKLGTTPTKTPSFPKQSDREANSVKPHIQEKFDDLVGKLLEEADEINEKYETYNLNAAFNINEPGEIGKQAGDLNSTAASAATGNMKPPTNNVGGATRSGRQGARAHGMTVGDQSLNRRGRDKVQEGQERVGDQSGSMKQKLSDDPQKDTSTGVGGKKVETDDAKFSVADKGKWTDDMARRLDKPQPKQFIVERQDGKLDPKLGELFRDVNSRQEQLIERVKAIKKELRNLYLPTEHLDEIEAQLQASLDRLKERPDAETFRQHLEALDKLRSSVRVFQAPAGGMESGSLRERAIKGRALDDPARVPLPGYEDATKRYYEQLSR